MKVCLSETQFQAVRVHRSSTFEELPHAYKLNSTHMKTGKNGVLGCKRKKGDFSMKYSFLRIPYSCDTS